MVKQIGPVIIPDPHTLSLHLEQLSSHESIRAMKWSILQRYRECFEQHVSFDEKKYRNTIAIDDMKVDFSTVQLLSHQSDYEGKVKLLTHPIWNLASCQSLLMQTLFLYAPYPLMLLIDASYNDTTVRLSECLQECRLSTRSFLYLMIVVSDGVSVTIEDDLTNDVNESHVSGIAYYVGAGARVSISMVYSWRKKGAVLNAVELYVKNDSIVNCMVSGFQKGFLYAFFHVIMSEPRAHVSIHGIVCVAQRAIVVCDTIQQHNSSSTISHVSIKSVVASHATFSYRGLITIVPGIAKVETEQANKNVMLARSSYVHSEPCLQVLSHDVHCKHGSATAKCDPEQLFYMLTRGYTDKGARRLLIKGFVSSGFSWGEGVMQEADWETLFEDEG